MFDRKLSDIYLNQRDEHIDYQNIKHLQKKTYHYLKREDLFSDRITNAQKKPIDVKYLLMSTICPTGRIKILFGLTFLSNITYQMILRKTRLDCFLNFKIDKYPGNR